MRHGVKSLWESWCRAECAPGWTQDERGPPKAMAVAQLFAPEIGRTPFQVARKMATLRIVVASVIIGNLYVEGVRAAPAKTQPPLPVDSQAILTLPVTGEHLQPVARRTT